MPLVEFNAGKTGTDASKVNHSAHFGMQLYEKNSVNVHLYCFLPGAHHHNKAKTSGGIIRWLCLMA
jgi:hypothetical protein